MKFADIIIDIAHERLDRPFQYRIPADLEGKVGEGMEVTVPFGKANKERKGYVIGLSDRAELDEALIKDIIRVNEKAVGLEGRILALAAWMKQQYGGTMITAMKTVLPVKKKIRENTYKTVVRLASEEELKSQIKSLNRVRYAARIRLCEGLLEAEEMPMALLTQKLNVSASVLNTAAKQGLIRIESGRSYRNPIPAGARAAEGDLCLTTKQQEVVDGIYSEAGEEHPRPALIRGITGSGKTEVYIALIEKVIESGKQAIVLIPEIALTFQTLMRFYARFGDRVSVLHSRLSDGERYDQYERARRGELDIMIGPRSALFTPFQKTGIIVIDEEHEGSYKSEKMPKYHAREVAEYLAEKQGALLVLGSATPSVLSYDAAKKGRYRLFTLDSRYGSAKLPGVHIIDLREELKAGNKSIFSRKLKELLTERIYRGEQSMIFINRRGVAGFISCRSCGTVLKCPHCDVSLTEHRNGALVCHYCGHREMMPSVCPSCGSKYIAGFCIGTEQVEDELKAMYPSAKVQRMDADTTKNKDDYERILSSFADGEADILVGTQMIVKGHDFPNVTLVGALAADMSLSAADFNAAERTFQLLAQAAGRAGRGDKPGEVVIQTYQPEHMAIRCAAAQDYEAFYEQEIGFRELAEYPPVASILAMQFFSADAAACIQRAETIAERLREAYGADGLQVLGPAPAIIGRLKDIWRYALYIRHRDTEKLIQAKDLAEKVQEECVQQKGAKEVSLQFDFNPVSGF